MTPKKLLIAQRLDESAAELRNTAELAAWWAKEIRSEP